MKGKSIFYRWLGRIFWLSAVAVTGYTWYYMDQAVPDRVSIIENEEEEFSFGLPLKATISSDSQEVALSNESNIPADQITISGRDHFSMFGGEKGSYQVGLKLFGVIKLKDIQVDVVDTRYAIPCGSPIGIYLKSDGVMVIGTGRITGSDGMEVEPAYGILKSGDYIEAFNGKPMNTKEDLIRAVSESGGQDCVLQVRREGEDVDISLKPVQGADGQYKLGAWVRDDTQGIGTLTYLDEDGSFGALGHGISDIDTSTLLNLQSGTLYNTDIRAVVKGENGVPGELSGIIRYSGDEILGIIEENTGIGIFGSITADISELSCCDALDIAYKQEIEEGPATLLSAVDGEVKEYDISIEKINLNSSDANKSMVIRVTDEELLEITGGIVQGMSGSPILQNGRIVGAVTHVFVNDPTKGYGIFIENMLEH